MNQKNIRLATLYLGPILPTTQESQGTICMSKYLIFLKAFQSGETILTQFNLNKKGGDQKH